MSSLHSLVAEAARELTICNSCRYCEGYCSVFPALERRAIITDADVLYLANLCHDCRACFQACMYAPPHEFGVNLPAALSEVRSATMQQYAWPALARSLFQHGMAAVIGFTALGLLLTMAVVVSTGGFAHLFSASDASGAFYRVVPNAAMEVPGLLVSAFIVVVLIRGGAELWRKARVQTGAGSTDWWSGIRDATWAAITLRNLRGGGGECYYPSLARSSPMRRVLHALVVTGFALAFLSTILAAAWQHLLGRLPPYPLLSLPVVTGSIGGVALIVGCSGLMYLKIRAPTGFAPAAMRSMDFAFLAVLNLASISGMLTLALRGTPWMGSMLVTHMAFLVSLYATAPYGKFVHSVYRLTALLIDAVERRSEFLDLNPEGASGL